MASYARTPFFHPLAMNSWRLWRRLHRAWGPAGPESRLRALFVAFSAVATGPIRVLERATFDYKLADYEIEEPPLFVLGHWRSGTTLLHNLLAHDPQFAYITTYQTLMPKSCWVGRHTLRHVVDFMMPPTRPMDEIAINVDSPQEEEYALCNITPCSFYQAFYFPQFAREFFQRYVLMDGISEAEREEGRRAYRYTLRKVSYLNGGKPLVLKNPASMGRLPELLRMFPNARFVCIHRNPYQVFKSTKHLYTRVFETVGLQRVAPEYIEQFVLDAYRDLMTKYESDRTLIPEGNLVEVRCEDLEAEPMRVIEHVYDTLKLPAWETAQPAIAAYLASLPEHQRNEYRMTTEDIEKIERHWHDALDRWPYARPQVEAG